jgi:outer membrane protein assembly factor BamE (lipoprotein component of BamABCDE complex)
MTSHLSKLLPVLAAAITLSACASLETSHPKSEQLSLIHPGLTQDEVRALAGSPENVTGDSRKHETLWIYSFTDLWGYQSEFDVTFGAKGLVTDTFAERDDY